MSGAFPPVAPAQADPTVSASQRARFMRPLQADAIRAAIGIAGELDVHTALRTGSTNTELLQSARKAAVDHAVVHAALEQTAGRGRRGRRWFAAPGSALLFSVALPVAQAMPNIAPLTLACGVALAETLRDVHIGGHIDGQVDVQLKWPNDLLVGERKLGGVLCELAVDANGARTVVVGVGINLWLDAAAHASIGQAAAALNEFIPTETLVDARERWIGRCVAALLRAAMEFEARGFIAFQPRFMRLFAHLNAEVDLLDQGTRIGSGRALGVDGEGRLLLQSDGQVRVISSGELSLRRTER